MRIVVKEDEMGWAGHSGIIMSKREGEFWVLQGRQAESP
jgi:hypothetical protein